MNKVRLLFVLLAVVLAASRLCHVAILWAEETLPLAAAEQMQGGKTLYRDVWFDKPPFTPVLYRLLGGQDGAILRIAGALYGLLACWVAWAFARDLWSAEEGLWAAGLMGFFLVFDFPSAVIPLATDLLMLAPHLLAVWLAFRKQPFWSGAAAGLAFLIHPKGLMVAAACAVWDPAGTLWIAAGFAAVSGAGTACLWTAGALGAYGDQVWRWGGIYAGRTFLEDPVRNGIVRTANWLGFHAALAVASVKVRVPRRQWLGWGLISLAGVAAGWRFFPRYYFQLLPVMVLLAARGFAQPGRKRVLAAMLLLIPAARFAPTYWKALRDPAWNDTAIDRDSRDAATLTRKIAKPGDTLFVWGYRPEIYVYSGLPAAAQFLDSQPLTGVPADRHLSQSMPVETEASREHRAELARSHPNLILDGLGPYNPRLAITNYPDLHDWLAHYQEAGRTSHTIIYARRNFP